MASHKRKTTKKATTRKRKRKSLFSAQEKVITLLGDALIENGRTRKSIVSAMKKLHPKMNESKLSLMEK